MRHVQRLVRGRVPAPVGQQRGACHGGAYSRRRVTKATDGSGCSTSGSGTPPQANDPHAGGANAITDRRVYGPDRYETAAAIARETHPSTVDTVLIATGENFPDAIVAGAAAAKLGGPVLLTYTGSLPSVTASELRRLSPRRIGIIGGPNAVSGSVESSLRVRNHGFCEVGYDAEAHGQTGTGI